MNSPDDLRQRRRSRLAAYDGFSRGGNPNADIVLKLKTERGLRYLVTAPGELRLARAPMSRAIWTSTGSPRRPYDLLVRARTNSAQIPDPRRLADIVRTLGPRMFVPPELPAQENPPGWRRLAEVTRLARDARAIAHHYDVSNRFYELVLGPSIKRPAPAIPGQGATLEQAQEFKFDLVCRKLACARGCACSMSGAAGAGWWHAVKEIHTRTRWGDARVSRRHGQEGSSARAWATSRRSGTRRLPRCHRVRLRGGLLHRPDRAHRGQELSRLFRLPRERLVSGACCSTTASPRRIPPGADHQGGFINRYVSPMASSRPVGTIIGAMADQGFGWHGRDLRDTTPARPGMGPAIGQLGGGGCRGRPGTARIRGLYLSRSSLGFERANQLHQVLGQRSAPAASPPLPAAPEFRFLTHRQCRRRAGDRPGGRHPRQVKLVGPARRVTCGDSGAEALQRA